MKTFDTYEEFFAWYTSELKQLVPDYENLDPGNVHKKLPELTASDVNEVISAIRLLIKIPARIYLVYKKQAKTYASLYHPVNKRIEIWFPTCTKLLLRYPSIVKTFIQHELGHVLGGDIFSEVENGHQNCANYCQDIRINAKLDYDTVCQCTQVLFGVGNSKSKLCDGVIYPEPCLEEINLPVDAATVLDWKVIHEMYHAVHPETMIASPHGGFPKLPSKPQADKKEGDSSTPEYESLKGQNVVIIFNGKFKGDWCEVLEEVKTMQGIVYKLKNIPKDKEQIWYGDSFCGVGDVVKYSVGGVFYIGQIVDLNPTHATIQSKERNDTIPNTDIIRLDIMPKEESQGQPQQLQEQQKQRKSRVQQENQPPGDGDGDNDDQDAHKDDEQESDGQEGQENNEDQDDNEGQENKEGKQSSNKQQSSDGTDGADEELKQSQNEKQKGDQQNNQKGDQQNGDQGDKSKPGESGSGESGKGEQGENKGESQDKKEGGEKGDKENGKEGTKEGEQNGEGKQSGEGEQKGETDKEGTDKEGQQGEESGEGKNPDQISKINQILKDKQTIKKITETIESLNQLHPKVDEKKKIFINKKLTELNAIKSEIDARRAV